MICSANDVTEQIIKGDIAIIKHTDDGETQIETPESGAEFQVFLKAAGSYENAKESERDVLVCDENGFAQSKKLPYGTYIVRQTKGWEGRELMDDFEVYIAQDGQTYRYLINNPNFESYIKVVKMTAILRFANAMDRSHYQKVKGIKAVLKDRELQMIIDSSRDISLELGLLRDKVKFFEEVFGIRLVLKRKRRA